MSAIAPTTKGICLLLYPPPPPFIHDWLTLQTVMAEPSATVTSSSENQQQSDPKPVSENQQRSDPKPVSENQQQKDPKPVSENQQQQKDPKQLETEETSAHELATMSYKLFTQWIRKYWQLGFLVILVLVIISVYMVRDCYPEVERLHQENDRLQKHIDNLNGDIGRLNGDIGRLNGDIGRLNGEINRLNGDIVSLEGKNSRLEEKNHHLEGQHSLYISELERLGDYLNREKSEHDGCLRELSGEGKLFGGSLTILGFTTRVGVTNPLRTHHKRIHLN